MKASYSGMKRMASKLLEKQSDKMRDRRAQLPKNMLVVTYRTPCKIP
jgi:hypothetical protein